MIGRRLATIEELCEPGDYCGPFPGYTGGKPAVFFLLPNSRDFSLPEHYRALHHVTSPPHAFRECPDGSVEIRESILAHGDEGEDPIWHGYLDEGHSWRTC